MQQNITFTSGPVLKNLLRFAFPVFGASILQACYTAADADVDFASDQHEHWHYYFNRTSDRSKAA